MPWWGTTASGRTNLYSGGWRHSRLLCLYQPIFPQIITITNPSTREWNMKLTIILFFDSTFISNRFLNSSYSSSFIAYECISDLLWKLLCRAKPLDIKNRRHRIIIATPSVGEIVLTPSVAKNARIPIDTVVRKPQIVNDVFRSPKINSTFLLKSMFIS